MDVRVPARLERTEFSSCGALRTPAAACGAACPPLPACPRMPADGLRTRPRACCACAAGCLREHACRHRQPTYKAHACACAAGIRKSNARNPCACPRMRLPSTTQGRGASLPGQGGPTAPDAPLALGTFVGELARREASGAARLHVPRLRAGRSRNLVRGGKVEQGACASVREVPYESDLPSSN